jgi:hypothetical protein
MTTTKENTYNGWTNYETWNIKLWLDNDGFSLENLTQSADPFEVSKELESYFDDLNPLADKANCFADLLGSALKSVNWYEIAEALIEDAKNE